MKNFSENEVRADMHKAYGFCDNQVYFKILKCRVSYDMFPYFFIKGKEYKLWIYANPEMPKSLTNVAIPGIDWFKAIPYEVFGDFLKAKDALLYAMYKEGTVPQDYSGYKRDFCKDKADYRLVRDFDRGLCLIPEERLSKSYILSLLREQYGKEYLYTVVSRIYGIPGHKKCFWEATISNRKPKKPECIRHYYDIISGEFRKSPFGVMITDRIAIAPHGLITIVDNVNFKNDGDKLRWSR